MLGVESRFQNRSTGPFYSFCFSPLGDSVARRVVLADSILSQASNSHWQLLYLLSPIS